MGAARSQLLRRLLTLASGLVLVIGIVVVAAEPAGAEAIDPYGSDLNRDIGWRDEVCRSNRLGRARLMHWLRYQWPQIENLWGYACREINNRETGEECNGEWEPDYSECWSTHASGRAIDAMVGGSLNEPTPEGVVLGDEIVTFLLTEREGHNNYYARRMGIQQILWNDRCWTGQREDDRQVLNAVDMRHCGIANHDNHVHLTMSNAGADALTSWYR